MVIPEPLKEIGSSHSIRRETGEQWYERLIRGKDNQVARLRDVGHQSPIPPLVDTLCQRNGLCKPDSKITKWNDRSMDKSGSAKFSES